MRQVSEKFDAENDIHDAICDMVCFVGWR